MNEIPEEHRQRPRVPLQLTATLELEGTLLPVSETRDLSMNGVLLLTPFPPVVGQEGWFRLALTSGKDKLTITAWSRVIRIADNQESKAAALEFLRLDFDSSVELYRLIRYQASEV